MLDPIHHRRFHAAERAALEGVRLVEQANFHRQLRTIAETKPDLIISNIITTNPLVGQGTVAKWGTEYCFLPIHGWAGVNNLVTSFTRALQRHAQLDPLGSDPIWLIGMMPSSAGGVISLQS
jgi:hypothetical protein